MSNKYKISEIFYSIQGEGPRTGNPTLWVRFFSCNLQCQGFGQDEPTKPETWDEQYKKIDLTDITSMEQLPVLTKGCDSAYSWAKRYRHLVPEYTAKEVVEKWCELVPHLCDGDMSHPNTGREVEICFTGGEPMLHQEAIVDIMTELHNVLTTEPDQCPFVTIETNGTKEIKPVFQQWLETDDAMVMFSVSPKLNSTSGELNKKALKPNVVANLITNSDVMYSWLKYVVDDSEECWVEMEQFNADILNLANTHSHTYTKIGYLCDVYVMPVGATVDDQSGIAMKVCEMAQERGYYFSTRLQNYVFGNAIGR